MALQPAREVELQQHDMDLPRGHARGADHLVDIDRARPESADDQLALALANIGQRLGRPMLVGGGKLDRRRARRAARGSAPASPGCRAREVTRQAPCFSRLLVPAERGSSGLPGTAKTSRPCSPAKRAVISEPERSAASTTTTPSEMPEIRRLRRGKSLPRGEKPGARSLMQQALLADGALQLFILGRVDDVDAAGEHGDGAVLERGKMRRRVDAAREARGDDEAFQAELGGELAGEFLPDGRAVARADNGDDGDFGELEPALGVEQGRRRIDLGKRRRIAGLADGDEDGPEPVGRLELGLGLGSRCKGGCRCGRRAATAAATRRWRPRRRRTH